MNRQVLRRLLVSICVLAAICGGALTGLCQSPKQQLAIESWSVVFMYPHTNPYDPTNLYGFNHAPSVATLPDGRLLCVWYSSPYEASANQVIFAALSSDEGRTWGRSSIIQDMPRMSDFDPALIVDGKRIWFFYVYGRWPRWPYMRDKEGEKNFIGRESFHLYARTSDDSGKTWSEERMIHKTARSRTNGIRLTSGELLLPVHDILEEKTCGLMKSVDGGKTWNWVGSVINPAGVIEPTIAELRNGTLMMVLRTNDSHLWTSLSTDKGETWSVPEQQEMKAGATSHNLFRISDGRVALTHNECELGLRTPLTMRVTSDGETWSEPIILAESLTPGEGNDYWGCQVTYPSVCEVSGKVLVAVWAKINISNTEQYGEIHSARVKVVAK